MKRTSQYASAWAVALLLFWTAGSSALWAATQQQYLTLQPGWNAVWLEVDPRNDDGASRSVTEVFDSPAITIVARPLNPAGTAQFISDPSRLFNQPGWVVWYKNPESGENTLASVLGNKAYLVYVDASLLPNPTSPVQLAVSGDASFFRPGWQAGKYNLLGFNLLSQVSFGDFFGSEGTTGGKHPVQLIFRLKADGAWTTASASDMMQPGEAYWIFAARSSTFNGPVSIQFDGDSALDFGSGPGSLSISDGLPGSILVNRRELTFFNEDTAAHSITLRKLIPATTGAGALADALRLYELVPKPNEYAYIIGTNRQVTTLNLGPLAGQASDTLSLGGFFNWFSGDLHKENLYRIEIDHQFFYLPVTADRSGLVGGTLGTPDESYSGLWAGSVVFDSVTALTETNHPIEPTPSKTPMRILVEVDTNGIASLLSQVILMQTKTNATDTNQTQVLVVDDSKIPYYQGVEERDGKLVGLRLSTVGYDMPRNFEPAVQTALVPIVATTMSIPEGSVTASNIEVYVNAQSTRPPELVESYYLTWPLEGGVGSGQSVQTTATGPLDLDAFHRSNPFRHAFHPRHGAGYAITRSLTITFDNSTNTDLLNGTYQEQVTGLASQPIVAQGQITLQRISPVGTVQ